MEDALDYVSSYLEDQKKGQGDLFGDLAEEEKNFSEFQFKKIPDIPNMEQLNMEKECIGCYVSGHPLDSYKKAIEHAVTVRANNIMRIAEESRAEKEAMQASGAKFWQIRDAGKSYIALGMISGLHEIITKKGDKMAFAKLSDYDGQIDITFFPKVWETVKTQLQDGEVYAFRGKVDLPQNRDIPSLNVDAIENIDELETHSAKSVHIQIAPNFNSELSISNLKNFLFDKMGTCSVYFHIDTGNNPYVVKANDQISITPDEQSLKALRDIDFVRDVWTE